MRNCCTEVSQADLTWWTQSAFQGNGMAGKRKLAGGPMFPRPVILSGIHPARRARPLASKEIG
jgi:hypothetical protein